MCCLFGLFIPTVLQTKTSKLRYVQNRNTKTLKITLPCTINQQTPVQPGSLYILPWSCRRRLPVGDQRTLDWPDDPGLRGSPHPHVRDNPRGHDSDAAGCQTSRHSFSFPRPRSASALCQRKRRRQWFIERDQHVEYFSLIWLKSYSAFNELQLHLNSGVTFITYHIRLVAGISFVSHHLFYLSVHIYICAIRLNPNPQMIRDTTAQSPRHDSVFWRQKTNEKKAAFLWAQRGNNTVLLSVHSFSFQRPFITSPHFLQDVETFIYSALWWSSLDTLKRSFSHMTTETLTVGNQRLQTCHWLSWKTKNGSSHWLWSWCVCVHLVKIWHGSDCCLQALQNISFLVPLVYVQLLHLLLNVSSCCNIFPLKKLN